MSQKTSCKRISAIQEKFHVSKFNAHKILGMIPAKERCEQCYKFAKHHQSGISDDGKLVESIYLCECGNKIGYQYSGRFVEYYRQCEENGSLEASLKYVEKHYLSSSSSETEDSKTYGTEQA